MEALSQSGRVEKTLGQYKANSWGHNECKNPHPAGLEWYMGGGASAEKPPPLYGQN